MAVFIEFYDGLFSATPTDFHFKRCSYQTRVGATPRSVTTIHWKSSINGLKYYLAVRAGKIVLEVSFTRVIAIITSK